MKKSHKILLGGAIVVVGLAITYRAVNQAPDASLPADQQVAQIMDDGGCVFCHTANPDLPFYAKFPIAKSLILKDVAEGYKAFDIAPMMQALAEGKAINEVDLAKVEKAVADGTMPLMQYYLVHWGSSLTSTKTDMVMAWVKQHREKFYPNTLAAAEFKTRPCVPSQTPCLTTRPKPFSVKPSITTPASLPMAPSLVPPATASIWPA